MHRIGKNLGRADTIVLSLPNQAGPRNETLNWMMRFGIIGLSDQDAGVCKLFCNLVESSFFKDSQELLAESVVELPRPYALHGLAASPPP